MRDEGYGLYDIISMAQFTFGAILLFSILCFCFHLYLTSRMAFWNPINGKDNRKAAWKRLVIPIIFSLIVAVIIPLTVYGTSDKLQTGLTSNTTEFIKFPWNYVLPAQGWLTDGGYSIQTKAWGVTLLFDAGLGFLFFWITGGMFLLGKKVLGR